MSRRTKGVHLGLMLIALSCLLSACESIHGWGQASSGGPAAGGAAITLPLGGK